MSEHAKDALVETLGVANPEARSGDPNERSDQVTYTSVDWVVKAGAEAAFVAEANAFRRWLLGQRGGWFVLLQDARDPSRFTLFGVFTDTVRAGPRPAFLERLAPGPGALRILAGPHLYGRDGEPRNAAPWASAKRRWAVAGGDELRSPAPRCDPDPQRGWLERERHYAPAPLWRSDRPDAPTQTIGRPS